jgi:Tat protein secretion system quality control protein TatD with DNase activity
MTVYVFHLFSSCVLVAKRNRAKTLTVIAAVPYDRLLLESDQDTVDTRLSDLQQGLDLVAEARGWTQVETLWQTHENAKRFYATRQQ